MMKKTLIALAATATTAAFAQVTLTGNLDQTAYSQGAAAGMASNANSSSLIKFSGSEDLGGGLKASFNLIGDLNLQKGSIGSTTTGAATSSTTTAQPSLFNRGANVALESASMGTLIIGRQNNAWWETGGNFSTSNSNSFGSNNLTAMQSGAVSAAVTLQPNSITTASYGLSNFNTNTSNDGNTGTSPFVFATGMSYTTPTWNGLSGKVVQSTSNFNDGGNSTGYSYSLNYGNGPLQIAYASSALNGTTTGVITGDIIGAWTQTLMAGSYSFGDFKVTALTNKSAFKGSAVGLDDTTLASVGLNYRVNPALDVSVAFSTLTNDETTTYKTTHSGITARYNVSKRTTVYGGWGMANNEGGMNTGVIYGTASAAVTGTTAGTSNAASMLGLRHTF